MATQSNVERHLPIGFQERGIHGGIEDTMSRSACMPARGIDRRPWQWPRADGSVLVRRYRIAGETRLEAKLVGDHQRRAMVKARGDRVCPRGRLFFSSQTIKGDGVDCGGMGIFPHSGGCGAGTAREDVLFGDVRIPLRADTLSWLLKCDAQGQGRRRRGRRGADEQLQP